MHLQSLLHASGSSDLIGLQRFGISKDSGLKDKQVWELSQALSESATSEQSEKPVLQIKKLSPGGEGAEAQSWSHRSQVFRRPPTLRRRGRGPHSHTSREEAPIDALRRSAPHAWSLPVRAPSPSRPLPTSKMAAGGADQVRGPCRTPAAALQTQRPSRSSFAAPSGPGNRKAPGTPLRSSDAAGPAG